MSTNNKSGITRREFLRDASIATLGASAILATGNLSLAKDEAAKKTDVVLVRNKDVLKENGNPKEEVVLEMLDAAVSTLTNEKDPADGWSQIIKPDDVVGIKTNVWLPIATTPAVEQALKTRVMDQGVKEEDIGIRDRGVVGDELFNRTTALINARPMRAHHWSGVGSLIKNYCMFVEDPYNYHEEACSRMGEIWTYPIVKDKTRLNVLVMWTPQFHVVGPHGFSPKHVAQYHGMLVGFDPVAVDTFGVKIIQGMRNDYFGEERPLSPSAKHIEAADTKWHIGTADPEKINLIKIGYDENSYI